MKKLLFAAAAIALYGHSVSGAAAQEAMMGETAVFALDFCPRGWAEMNGQLLSIAQNTGLFSLLGTRYGGDGTSTFALPAAKPIYAANGEPLKQCIALYGIFPSEN